MDAGKSYDGPPVKPVSIPVPWEVVEVEPLCTDPLHLPEVWSHQIRAVRLPDGRLCFPDVVWYRVTDGDLAGDLTFVPPDFASHPLPTPFSPAASAPYATLIQPGKLAAYEWLAATGRLGLGHAYLEIGGLFDNRRTS